MSATSQHILKRLIEGVEISGSITFCGMTIVVMVVTPEIAADMLTRNQTNRKIRKHIVRQYADDMRSGRWQPSMTPVCITPEGNTTNGAHRLSAIVLSGFSQQLLIAYNVLPETVAMMDIGLKRSLSDIAKFMGADMSNIHSAVARIMMIGPRGSRQVSFAQTFDFYIDNAEAIDWAIKHSKGHKAYITSPILAVVAKAWYTQPVADRLEEFMRVLVTGICENSEQDIAAIKLRDYARSTLTGGEIARSELYKRTQTALKAFLDKKPLKLLRASDQDYFPMPEDER